MSSASCPSLELQCRPSAWLRAAVLVLAFLAAVSVGLSALPVGWLALVPVLAVLGWRGTGAHGGMVLRFGGDGSVLVDRGTHEAPRSAELLGVEERGPLLVLVVRLVELPTAANGAPLSPRATLQRNCGSGVSREKRSEGPPGRADRGLRRSHRPPGARVVRLCFGPDTAAAGSRRALRLWCARHARTADGALATAGLR